MLTNTSRMSLSAAMPNFFIIGAMRAGTTSLYHYLRQHPDVYMPADKELHFFDIDEAYEAGVRAYVSSHFRDAAAYPARGEATPAYLARYERVIPRMLEVFGAAHPRFIILFREPAARAWSHYLHSVRKGVEAETFERALELEQHRVDGRGQERGDYFSRGCYAQQLDAWLGAFPRDRFLFLLTEDLRSRPHQAAADVFEFLGVDPTAAVDTTLASNRAFVLKQGTVYRRMWRLLVGRDALKERLRRVLPGDAGRRLIGLARTAFIAPSKTPPRIPPEIDRVLREKYADDVRRLETILGRDLSSWYSA